MNLIFIYTLRHVLRKSSIDCIRRRTKTITFYDAWLLNKQLQGICDHPATPRNDRKLWFRDFESLHLKISTIEIHPKTICLYLLIRLRRVQSQLFDFGTTQRVEHKDIAWLDTLIEKKRYYQSTALISRTPSCFGYARNRWALLTLATARVSYDRRQNQKHDRCPAIHQSGLH